MKLKNAANSQIIFANLIRAESIKARFQGLLGRKGLAADEAMWITQCSSIHTFFMKFAIDCVFVDAKGTIRKIYHNVVPWRIAGPVFGATDVVEMSAGQAKLKNLQIGDVIECGP
jgi:uncharacterized membrane protein (UPF0127 family)